MTDRGLTQEQAWEFDRLQHAGRDKPETLSERMSRMSRSRKTFSGGKGARREGAGRPRVNQARCLCGAFTEVSAAKRCHVCFFGEGRHGTRGFSNTQKAYRWLQHHKVVWPCSLIVKGRPRGYDPSTQRLSSIVWQGEK